MSVEQHHERVPLRRAAPHTYFVGRRIFEATEVYAVTASDIERLRSGCRYGEPDLDWHGSGGAGMELSDLLISRVAERRASRQLERRFARHVLAQLPDGGFVLDSDALSRWLRLASEPEDFLLAPAPKQSFVRGLGRLFGAPLRALFGGPGYRQSDG